MPKDIRDIGNKQVRAEQLRKLKADQKYEKTKERRKRQREDGALGDRAPPKKIPKTLDNQREAEVTVVQPDDMEVAADMARDEYATPKAAEPKLMITTSEKPNRFMYAFLGDLLRVFPNSFYYKRGTYRIKEICKYATDMGFTDLLVVTEHQRRPYQLILSHLPEGPTATFRLRNVVLAKQIKGHGEMTTHKPELILNRFSTRLGIRVGRVLQGLFPKAPQFSGRRVVTFHNQRDFIFMRQHRYIFEEDPAALEKNGIAARVRLQELGPRMTLKLMSIQEGTFDTLHGEYEFIRKKKDEKDSRRKFAL